jgi:hypothetical protein
MSKTIAIQVEGKTLFVETDETVEIPAPKATEVKRGRRIPKGAREVVSVKEIKQDFGEVKDVIIACCNSLYNAVASIPKPERFAIEFGIKLAGETGVPLLTKASGEANFKIMVEWKDG